jgi:acetolactate synthase-1/2/3 large subunit
MHKFSDDVANWLLDKNYKCCFFVAGGNIMHLMDSFSNNFLMIPVIHEVTAVIAADYYNEANSLSQGKAFALVTLGPGVTNTATGVMGSFLDSRELLLISGQVKSQDLKKDKQRQRGIQEIEGISFFQNFTKIAKRITEPICRE